MFVNTHMLDGEVGDTDGADLGLGKLKNGWIDSKNDRSDTVGSRSTGY